MPDVGDAFADIFDAIAPVIVEIADILGFPLNLIVGFFFGGLDFILSEVLF